MFNIIIDVRFFDGDVITLGRKSQKYNKYYSLKFRKISYIEYMSYIRTKFKIDEEIIKYLFLECLIEDNGFDYELYNKYPILLLNIVNKYIEKLDYHIEDETLKNMISASQSYYLTYEGLCDAFIYQHGGWEMLKDCYSQSPQYKATITGFWQAMTGIDVNARREEAIALGVPPDLSVREEDIKEQEKENKKAKSRLYDPKRLAELRAKAEQGDMQAQLQLELIESIRKDKQQGEKKRYYNWNEDLMSEKSQEKLERQKMEQEKLDQVRNSRQHMTVDPSQYMKLNKGNMQPPNIQFNRPSNHNNNQFNGDD